MTKDTPKAAKTKPPRYQNRIVLFLDFLGFKEHVERSARDPAFLKRLVAAMDAVGEIGTVSALKSQRVTQFSDSIVVSFKVKERSAVFNLLNAIAIGVVDLADRGFLVRGAVTIGALYHSKSHVIGPAMNEAVRLESKVANYPRVLIDPNVLAAARKARSRQHAPAEEAGYAADFMTQDKDGHYFFDYIAWRSVVDVAGGRNERYGHYLGRLADLIREGLRHDDPRVQDKYLWLLRRYRATIKGFRNMPADDGYRAANAAMCEVIANLPTFKADARLAKAAIRKAAREKDKR